MLKRDVETVLRDDWPPELWQDVTVLVAVSGGADSVGLLRALVAIRPPGPGRIVVAHYNHELRKNAADDERFVGQLAQQLDLEIALGRASSSSLRTPARSGIEATARRHRYQFLRQTATRTGARYVVTAHTADDQAETILHRLIRGTGVSGLAGIPRTRRLSELTTIVRPMLAIRRHALREYLEVLGQVWRHDESNDDQRFTRNRIRHDLLPLLAGKFNPRVVDAVCRLGTLAAENQAVIGASVQDLMAAHVTTRADGVEVHCRELRGAPAYLIREVLLAIWRRQRWGLQAIGLAELTRLARLIQDGADRARNLIEIPGGVRAKVDPSGTLLLRQSAPPVSAGGSSSVAPEPD